MSSDIMDPKIPADAAMAFADQGRMEEIRKLADRGTENIEKVAAKFEAVFLGILIKQMWESIERSELCPEGPGRQIFDGLFTTMLADHIADSGGIGIAKGMVEQLERAASAYRTESSPGRDDEESAGSQSPETIENKNVTGDRQA